MLPSPCKPPPSGFTGSTELNAMVARIAPAILALLADGVPRTKAAIVAALELLDGTDMGPLPAFATVAHRRRHNQATHAVDQARTYLRRAVELVSRPSG